MTAKKLSMRDLMPEVWAERPEPTIDQSRFSSAIPMASAAYEVHVRKRVLALEYGRRFEKLDNLSGRTTRTVSKGACMDGRAMRVVKGHRYACTVPPLSSSSAARSGAVRCSSNPKSRLLCYCRWG